MNKINHVYISRGHKAAFNNKYRWIAVFYYSLNPALGGRMYSINYCDLYTLVLFYMALSVYLTKRTIRMYIFQRNIFTCPPNVNDEI